MTKVDALLALVAELRAQARNPLQSDDYRAAADIHADRIEAIARNDGAQEAVTAESGTYVAPTALQVALMNAADCMERHVRDYHKPRDCTITRKQARIVRDHMASLYPAPPNETATQDASAEPSGREGFALLHPNDSAAVERYVRALIRIALASAPEPTSIAIAMEALNWHDATMLKAEGKGK
jgi:hypothetical protein